MPPPTKKRKTEQSAVEEIKFDLEARQEYLTGFHKRKLQRTKHAQEAAEKRAREDRIEERKKLREERKADLERHVQEINAMLRPVIAAEGSEDVESGESSGTEWNGVEDETPPPIDHEAEYVDEEKYTTVTVEEIDVSKEGLRKAERQGQQEDRDARAETDVDADTASSKVEKPEKRGWAKEKPKDKSVKPKAKRKKFRYEGKAERKFTRMKEKSKNSKQAKARREK